MTMSLSLSDNVANWYGCATCQTSKKYKQNHIPGLTLI